MNHMKLSTAYFIQPLSRKPSGRSSFNIARRSRSSRRFTCPREGLAKFDLSIRVVGKFCDRSLSSSRYYCPAYVTVYQGGSSVTALCVIVYLLH